MQIGFTVIVPTRNRAAMALELVQYLRGRLKWTSPIVLIDQSDDAGSALAKLLAEAQIPDVTHRVQHQRGTSIARNEGVRLARTPWLLFIDDDVRPIDGYLTRLEAFITENPWVDAIQGAVEYQWEEYNENKRAWESQRKRLAGTRPVSPKHWGGLEWLLRTPKAQYPCMVLGLGAGNLAVSRDAFFGVGGFDEQCEGLGEDIELGVRFWWYGYRTSLCPEAVAFHLRAQFGGTRNVKSRWKTLFAPEPTPSLPYFLLKWFPGRPFWEETAKQSAKWFRRPWVIPIKVIRMTRSIRIAKRRLRQGPKYLSEPMCRVNAMQSETYEAKVASR